ncbi:MAG: acetyltransferase [Veillonellaceae bacterium]|jgi:UDP-perosamine 4-acetyltransferase|nr:acetyltransferase [Veillonellaceae bacterium]
MFHSNDLLVIGGGGHAKVIIDILAQQKTFTLVGIIDRRDRMGQHLNGIPIIGDDSQLESFFRNGLRNAVIAIGDNQRRADLYEILKKLGFNIVSIAHPSAVIAATVHLSTGAAIMPGAVLNADCMVKENVIINTKASIDHDCRVMEHCHIAPGCTLAGGVSVGAGTLLGAGTTVLPGIDIGAWSIIGAGSVVVSAIPDRVVAYGVPARIIRHLD